MRALRTTFFSLLLAAWSGPLFAANQLLNPGFTSNLSNWTPSGLWPPVWDGSQGNTAPGALREDAVGGPAAGSGVVNQCTSATGGGLYDYGVSFRINPASTQTGKGRVRGTWWTGAGCTGTSTTDPSFADSTAATGWQSLAVNNVLAPAGTQSVLFETIQTIDGAGTFSAPVIGSQRRRTGSSVAAGFRIQRVDRK